MKRILIAAVAAALLWVSFSGGNTGCGSGAEPPPVPQLKVTVLDKAAAPMSGAFVMLGIDPATEFQGTTDASGQITFTDEDLGATQTITAGKDGYRNYTIVGVTATDVKIVLNEIDRLHGYINASIDPATWDPIALDNCPAFPAPPCFVRFAWVQIPTDDVTYSQDLTDCAECLGQSPFIIPVNPAQAQKKAPAFLDQTRAVAVAGTLDLSTFIFSFEKYGIQNFSIDATNTAANPKDVMIPLAYTLGDDAAVTISVLDQSPSGLSSMYALFNVDMPNIGFNFVGVVIAGNALSGTRISDFSYRFRGLNSDAVAAAGGDLTDASYLILGGLSNAEGSAQSYYVDRLNFSNAPQAFDVQSLLPSMSGVSPTNNGVIDPTGTAFSWNEIQGATFYNSSLSTLYLNGTDQGSKNIWQVLIPPGTNTFTLPVFPSGTLTGLQACQVYKWEVDGVAPTGFNYEDGNFSGIYNLLFGHLPFSMSTSMQTLFTSGTGCGPIISAIAPVEGAAGDQVTISGMYFGPAQGASTVLFDATPAAVTAWSDTSITVGAPAGFIVDQVATINVTVGGQISNAAYFVYR
ncbi:MAG: IPT/TIG domain-containing protein [bacterium]